MLEAAAEAARSFGPNAPTLLAVTALIVARFFDSDITFLLRGLLFIALGVAFLITNMAMLRRKGVRREQA